MDIDLLLNTKVDNISYVKTFLNEENDTTNHMKKVGYNNDFNIWIP